MATKLKIEDHKLKATGIKFVPSPNHSGPFAVGLPDTLVIHFTAGSSFDSSVAHLASEKAKASAHVVIGREGQITQLVPFDTVAWHAGKSQWKGRSGLNQYSIGIELDNAGELTKNAAGHYLSWFNRVYDADEVFEGVHRNQQQPSFWHAYSQAQIEATFELCALLCETYGIQEIVGHEEIAPARKTDPGPAFPLDRLRRFIDADRAQDGPESTVTDENLRRVVASKLNVRSGPGTQFAANNLPLTQGQAVTVLEKQGEWSKIEYKVTGWVSSRFLS